MENLELFKALANEHRLQILYYLKDPKAHFTYKSYVDIEEVGVCVGELKNKLGLTQSTTSNYLSILEKAGLLKSERIGKWTYYRRNESTIAALADFVYKEL